MDDQFGVCDTCGKNVDYMPWHYSTDESRHNYACDECWTDHMPWNNPGPLRWKTVQRHGQPIRGSCILWMDHTSDSVRLSRHTSQFVGDFIWWLYLSDIHGHPRLPDRLDVAPVPEPELPEPWLAPGAMTDADPDEVIAYAWALNGTAKKVVISLGTPDPHGAVAWCPLVRGQVIPPHPHERTEQ